MRPAEAAGRDEQDGDAERGDGDGQEQAEGQSDARAALDLAVSGETGRGAGRDGRGAAAGARPVEGGRGRTWEGRPPRRVVTARIVACRGQVAGGPSPARRVGVAAAVRSVVVLPRPARGQEVPCRAPIRGIGCRHETPSATARRADRPAGVRRRTDRPRHPAANGSAVAPARSRGPPGARPPRPGGSGGERRRARRPDADPRPAAVPGPRRPAAPPALSGPAADARRLRPAEPPPERLPALLHDRLARRDPDPGAAPPEGADPPGRERLPLPAPRRRPPRAGLRQRRLPDARASTSASSTRTS